MGWEHPPCWLAFTEVQGVMQAAEGAKSLTDFPSCEPYELQEQPVSHDMPSAAMRPDYHRSNQTPVTRFQVCSTGGIHDVWY